MRFFRRAYGRHVIHMLLVKKSCGSKFRSPSSIIALFPTICSHNARKFLEERNLVALIPFCTDRYRQSIARIGRFHSHLDCSPTQAIVSPAPPPALSLDSPTLLFPSVHSSHTQSPHCLATPLGYCSLPWYRPPSVVPQQLVVRSARAVLSCPTPAVSFYPS